MNGNPEVSRLDHNKTISSLCSVGPTCGSPRGLLAVPSRRVRPPRSLSRTVHVSSYSAGGVSVLRRTAVSVGVRMVLTACPSGTVVTVSSLRILASIRSRGSFTELRSDVRMSRGRLFKDRGQRPASFIRPDLIGFKR